MSVAAARPPMRILFLALFLLAGSGCVHMRTTDPDRTATEQFLITEAIVRAAEQVSVAALRDKLVFVDETFLEVPQQRFLLAELRTRLLISGVRLTTERAKAQIVLEPRSGGVGIDRSGYLVGVPSFGLARTSGEGDSVSTPELAMLKRERQRGYASIALIAYWADSGELVASSGPFIGRSIREDYWIMGTGPRTAGNIATTERPR